MFSYFLQILLEEAQNFASIDKVHRVVIQSGYHSRSKERRERLRYTRVSNP